MSVLSACTSGISFASAGERLPLGDGVDQNWAFVSPIALLGIYMGIMAKATWDGAVLAESDKTVEVEGNQYFPPEAIHQAYFKTSDAHSVCPWKGTASYYDLEVNGKKNEGAAWFYPEPKAAAKQIKGYVAFWKGVKVEK